MHYHTTYFHSFLHIFHYIDPNHQSMDSSSSSLPIKAIHSFHAGERNLYTRLAFDLYIDPSCSLHLIAFWLWLEEDGNHKNLIHKITSMTNNSLRSAAHTALSFLDALQTNPNPTSTAFHKNAINGIHYYLSNVCYKALIDLHEKAASQLEARRGVEMIGHSLSCVYLSEVNGLLYVPNSEGSSGNEARRYDKSQMIGLKEEVKPWISCFYTEESNIESCIHAKPGGEYRSNIPRDERMLFVTFSNGYPLTEEELYSFFIRNFGEVERVKVEQVGGRRQQPLFAQVSFYSLSTVLAILNGHYKVKFLINGKHLWVRRFVPKRKHKQANGF